MQGSAQQRRLSYQLLQCAYYATYLQAINLHLLTALRAALSQSALPTQRFLALLREP